MPETPVTDPGRTPENFKPLPDCFYCPDCGESFLSNTFRYTAATSGTEWGSCHINSDGQIEEEVDDSETQDSSDYTYECRECDHEFNTRPMRDTLEWIRQNVLRVTANQIRETVEVRGMMTFTPQGAIPQPQRRMQNITRAPKIFGEINNNTEGYLKVWHAEMFNFVKAAAIAGHIPMFNWNYVAYNVMNPSPQQPEMQTQEEAVPTAANEDPENHMPVMEENHSRWGRGVTYPNQVQCPNDTCHYLFIADSSDELEIMCPRCKTEFDPRAEVLSESDGQRIRFRPVTGQF